MESSPKHAFTRLKSLRQLDHKKIVVGHGEARTECSELDLLNTKPAAVAVVK
jgi:hypothetical protein